MTQGMRQGSWPKVSVVMSTYNRPDRLRKAVQCVLDQTFTDFELIVVDDASGTAVTALEDFVERFEDRGIHFTLIELDENSGYQARPKNVGISYARGSYIANADDDDEWYPHHLETLVDVLESMDCDLAYGSWDFGGDREGERWEHIPFNHLTAHLILSSPQLNFISCHTVYSKAAALVTLGRHVFDEDLRRFGDWDVYRRMLERGLRFRGVDEATYKYVWHGENLQLTRPASTSTVRHVNDGNPEWDGKVQ